MLEKTKLHYTEFLSITDGRLLCEMEGVYKAMDVIVGPGVSTITLSYLGKHVKEYLQNKYLWFISNRVAEAISMALSEWKLNINSKHKDLDYYLDLYVLPLCPGVEIEVEPMEPHLLSELQKGYGAYLKKVFADKEVIAVVVPDINEGKTNV